MKTFEEALSLIAPTGCGDIPVAVVERMKDLGSRNIALIGEIVHNENALDMLEGVLDKVPMRSAMMTAFINGILIGIEMERAEVGKLAQ